MERGINKIVYCEGLKVRKYVMSFVCHCIETLVAKLNSNGKLVPKDQLRY
jgi:hypothetical protein